ncbi:S9 family peptidase [Luteimonas sp. RIT-PG2_3]
MSRRGMRLRDLSRNIRAIAAGLPSARTPSTACSGVLRRTLGIAVAGLLLAGHGRHGVAGEHAPGERAPDTRAIERRAIDPGADAGIDLRSRYQHAAQYLPWMITRHVRGMRLQPQWSADGRVLRYAWDIPSTGDDAGERSTRSPPDESLSDESLPYQSVQYEVALETGEKTLSTAPPAQTAAPAPVRKLDDDIVVSPNGQWGVRVVDGNLYRVALTQDGATQQTALTTDAEPDHVYGLVPQWTSASLTSRLAGTPSRPYGLWSPDGHRFLTYRVDERKLYKLPHVVPLVPGARHQVPYLHLQNTAWPDSEHRQEAELIVFDMRSGTRTNLDIPRPGVGYSPTPEGGLRWSRDGNSIYAAPETRDFRSITLYQADAGTGRARAILSDGPAKTALQPDIDGGERFLPVGDGDEIIVYSERSDWGHYYLHDGRTGALKQALTQGEWSVHGVAHIDTEGRWLYFLAGGREPGHDRYYSHLYRVRLDGSGLTLLTPEDAHHEVQFSPDGRHFIDTASTVAMSPVHTLRTSDGTRAVALGKADTRALDALGWTSPRRFSVKAADGVTDLYGVMFLPSDFDDTRRYPIIDAQYGANFRIQTPRSFLRDSLNAMALSQLGFVVIHVDGRGTPLRSQSMQDLGFGRWDINLDDHVAAITQLAQRHRFIDIDRVGIYGHSAGGYSTVHAMLERPAFFKVGVASAGSHDFNLFIYPVNRERGRPQEYPAHFEPTNLLHADRLQGKLMLAHGYVDDNVHVANTLQMADALIRANKDFELFIHPSLNHQAFYRNGYVNRKIWNYFVAHLAGQTPPTDVRLPDLADATTTPPRPAAPASAAR